MNKNRGFTLIELTMSIVIAGILLVSIAVSYKQIVMAVTFNAQLSKVLNLSQREVSIIKSLAYADATLANNYNILTSNYASSGFDLRRLVTYEAGTDATPQSLKHITVTIYRNGSSTSLLKTDILRAKNVTFAP